MTHLFLCDDSDVNCKILNTYLDTMNTVTTTELDTVSLDICSENTKYECVVCNRRFTRKDTLNSHAKLHNEEKKYECLTCGRRFRRKDTLTCHMRVHSNEKNYECLICNKRFNRKDILSSHMNVHSDEKNYECPLCHRRFSRKDTLSCHMNVHGEKKFECVVCNKRFSRKDSLGSHMNMHGDDAKYECRVCRKRFTRNSSLVKHVRSHVKEPTYQCQLCYTTCKTNTNIEKHALNHREICCNSVGVMPSELQQPKIGPITPPNNEAEKLDTETQLHNMSHNVDLDPEMPFEVEVNPFLFMEDEAEVCTYGDTRVNASKIVVDDVDSNREIELATKNPGQYLTREVENATHL